MYYLITLIICLLISPDVAHAQSPVIITEVGAHEPTGAEWVELYNTTSAPTDLTGWRFWEDDTKHKISAVRGGMSLPAGSYAILAQDGAEFAAARPECAIVIDSSWNSLRLDGEEVGLADSSGAVVERFTYPPIVGRSIQRREPFADGETNAWDAHPTGDSACRANEFGDQSSPDEPVMEAPTPAATPTPDGTTPLPQIGSVLINEIVSDPASGDEWVELRNLNDFPVDLAGWTLTEGAGGTTMLSGTIGVHAYIIFASLEGALNNSGDLILLKNQSENLFDQLAYGSWDDDSPSDNPPAAPDPYSLARDANTLVWSVTTSITKASVNIIDLPQVPVPTTTSAGTSKKPAALLPVISELFPNPPGDDTAYEYIELHNPSTDYTDIAGWKIVDSEHQEYVIPENTVLRPGDYLSFDRRSTSIALDNSGDTITLYDRNEKRIDRLTYSDDVPEGASIMRDGAQHILTATPTRAAANLFTEFSLPPVIKSICEVIDGHIICDASDSYDPNGDALTFSWIVESVSYALPRIDHTVATFGKLPIWLTVTDGVLSADKKISISVAAPEADAVSTSTASSNPLPEEAFAGMEPAVVALDDIEALAPGMLITVSGIANKVTAASVYLSDGSTTVRAQFPKEGPTPVKGTHYEATGIIKLRAGAPYILIDDPEHLVPLAPEPSGDPPLLPIIAGAPIEVPKSDKNSPILIYLGAALTAAGCAWWMSRRRKPLSPTPIRANLYDTS